MGGSAGVVDVFGTPYEKWSQRKTSIEEAMDLVKNKGFSLMEALQVNDKCIARVSTHVEAATYILRQRADNGLEDHIDNALNASAEYNALRGLMPQDEPAALSLYQGRFSGGDWLEADKAIKTHGVELAEGQLLFHGGYWASKNSSITTLRPFSTSFCPQVAFRNAEWKGKAFDAGRVDLMVVRVTQPKTKAYAYSRNGDHGNEKEIVFASGAQLTCVRKTHIADITAYKMNSNGGQLEKIVRAYVIEAEIS